MKASQFTIAIVTCWFGIAPFVDAQGFDELVKSLSQTAPAQQEQLIIEYITSEGGLPLIEGDTVVFMAKSPFTIPRISSGFNGFLSPRYIKDPEAGKMHRIEGTSWYFLKRHLYQDARIFYQIIRDSIAYNDPLNHRLGYRFNMINSEVRMPEFAADSIFVGNSLVRPGTVSPVDVDSQTYPDRKVHIYLPPGYQANGKSYPVLLFHDGSAYIEMGQVPTILDNLIASGRIPPLIAVFDDPLIRGQEYRGDSVYIKYIDQELIPFVDKHYQTIPDAGHRAVIGGSRGGLSSLILSHTIDKFSKCGVFSPAIHPQPMKEFIEFLESSNHKPSNVFVLGAVYDKVWYQDAVVLKDYFGASQVQIKYMDINQGHNIQSWVTELDTLLEALF